MKVITLDRRLTNAFSQQQINLAYDQSIYLPYLSNAFSKEAFAQQISLKGKQYSSQQRESLVATLKKQYEKLSVTPAVTKNMELLREENTFTVVTGHQLVAFTGPLYFIYKIAHIVKMCSELKDVYPANNFVPVFWMATEDHDYDEIKSFHLFNRTLTWETEQSGAVGRFKMKDWEPVIEELKSLFQNHPESSFIKLVESFEGETYVDAFRVFLNEIIGQYGVVIIDGDDRQFKELFAPIMKKDVLEQFSFHAISSTTDELVSKGLKQQIIPRDINLFYLEGTKRERLNLVDNKVVIDGIGTFTKEEIVAMIDESPEKFSPNVSLRPMYQELLLPNLCYVGGAGEINYWMQLKAAFEVVDVIYPLIETRNSILFIDKNTSEKIAKLNLSYEDLFKETHVLTKAYLEQNAGEELDFTSLDNQMELLRKQLIDTTIMVDPALESYATAEAVRLEKQLNQVKDRLYKTVKGKHDKNLKNIQQIKEKLFPGGGLQERYTNFFQLVPNGEFRPLLDEIIQLVQPFNPDFLILEEV